MKAGFVESAIYYCNQLIKGSIIPRDIKKAKKILESQIKEKDPGSYFLLYGKISKHENKYDECQKYFEKSISLDNKESMYQYGKLLIKNNDSISSKEKGYSFIEKSIDKGYWQGMYKYGIYLIRGDGIIKDVNKGMQYLKIVAEK